VLPRASLMQPKFILATFCVRNASSDFWDQLQPTAEAGFDINLP